MEHVALAERADLLVVAPATANVLAKAAHGLADDFLTTLLLAARGPVLMAPAMDGGMWEHPAVRRHVATLREPRASPCWSRRRARSRPASAARAGCPRSRTSSRRPSRLLWPARDLAGEHVLVTAGPTREPIDPVRFLCNRSSGRMGYAIAAQAARRGAAVTLVSGPTTSRRRPGVRVVPVQTAEEMREAVLHAADAATIVIKAAAVADYRPERPRDREDQVEAGRAHARARPDPRHPPGARRPEGRALPGRASPPRRTTLRAARPGQARRQGHRPPRRERREPGATSASTSDDNEVVLLDRWGGVVALPRRSKVEVADPILDRVQALRRAARAPQAPLT